MSNSALRFYIRNFSLESIKRECHYVKGVRICSFSGPCFPASGLNTETYGVNLHIQSKCGKIRTRKTANTDTFHVVTFTFNTLK